MPKSYQMMVIRSLQTLTRTALCALLVGTKGVPRGKGSQYDNK